MAPPPRTAPSTATRGPILVVEDDYDTREIMRQSLAREGYAVRVAADGAEALGELGAHAELPRLILLDIQMPVMDGREFLARVSGDRNFGGIPVVITSATGKLYAGAKAFLRKPVDIAQLLDLVASLCAMG